MGILDPGLKLKMMDGWMEFLLVFTSNLEYTALVSHLCITQVEKKGGTDF